MLVNNEVHNTNSNALFKKGRFINQNHKLFKSYKKVYKTKKELDKKSYYWVFSETWEDYENSRIIEVKSIFDTTLKLKQVYLNVKK